MDTNRSALVTKIGYELGYTHATGTPVTTTIEQSFLPDGIKELLQIFYRRECWKLLTELQKTATYTLTGASSYDVYDIIGSHTDYWKFLSRPNGTTWSRVGEYPLREVSAQEEHKIQDSGRYEPTESDPYICFWGVDHEHGNLPIVLIRPDDSTEDLRFVYLRKPGKSAITYTSGGTTAIVGGNTITGGTSSATALVVDVPDPSSGSWAGGDAAGTLYCVDVSGTFQNSEALTVGGSDLATSSSTMGTKTILGYDTDKPPLHDDCESALIYYCAWRGWSGRHHNLQQAQYYRDRFDKTIFDLIAEYEDPMWESPEHRPVL